MKKALSLAIILLVSTLVYAFQVDIVLAAYTRTPVGSTPANPITFVQSTEAAIGQASTQWRLYNSGSTVIANGPCNAANPGADNTWNASLPVGLQVYGVGMLYFSGAGCTGPFDWNVEEGTSAGFQNFSGSSLQFTVQATTTTASVDAVFFGGD